MAKSTKALLRSHWLDLVHIILILLKELIVAATVLCSGRFLIFLSNRLYPQGGWSNDTIRILSDLFAILAFVALAVRDLRRYLK